MQGYMGHRQLVAVCVASIASAVVLTTSSPAQARRPGGSPGGGLCDAAAVDKALASASSGDVVRIGACRVEGAFNVPHGVRLEGVHPWASTLVVSGDGAGVQLCSGDRHATALRNLRVVSRARAGVAIGDRGHAVIQNVIVEAHRGVGIGAEGVAGLSLERVVLQGPVTRRTADAVDPHVSPTETATHGLVAGHVADLRIEDVRTDGFSSFGALLVDSHTRWSGGSASNNVGVGVMVWGGEASFDHVSVARTWRGHHPHADGARSAGLAVAGGATVATRAQRVLHNEGWGVFHSAAGVAEHEGLWGVRNASAGVWYQNGEYLQLDDARLLQNGDGGVVAIDSDLTSIADTTVIGTRLVDATEDGGSGDGIQLVDTEGHLSAVQLIHNERIGLLLKAVKGVAPCFLPNRLTAEQVRVVGGADGLGAVFQHHGETELVEDGVRRFGRVAGNDQQLQREPVELGVAQGVAPCFLPLAELVASEGLGPLLGDAQHDHPLDPIP